MKHTAAIMLDKMPYLVLMSQLWWAGIEGSNQGIVTLGVCINPFSVVIFNWSSPSVRLVKVTSDIIGHNTRKYWLMLLKTSSSTCTTLDRNYSSQQICKEYDHIVSSSKGSSNH
uniref:Uncharacterized protein n=1 Tax=Arion vulgaris TaxID=1028688 RepID=A0A0B6XX70_9EUPU